MKTKRAKNTKEKACLMQHRSTILIPKLELTTGKTLKARIV